jgi:glycerol-3-phosphate dehydrogenase
MHTKMIRQPRYDLIVIGGGITGCGVAYEAAVRGASVLVLDQGDFAVGTSSRSTKLIHGGIRYLKQFDFRLVREGVRERQSLIDTIPYLVHPIQFVYPVHSGDPDPLWALRAGLILYDWFAGRGNLLPHRVHAGRDLLDVEPLLREDGLKGGALYADCLTDDARLTVEVAKAAQRAGAVLVNYVAVRRFLYDDNGRLVGVEAFDRLGNDQPIELHTGAVLNATGPWVDMVRQLDDPGARPVLRPTKGVHIAVPHERLPVRRPVVMHAADNRLMFAVPRDGFTYLGTTDTDFTGDPAAVTIDRSDVSYILSATNRMFPKVGLTEADVVSAWAGIRSLAATSETAGPSQVSRDYKLHTSQSGLVSVAGGKLTAFVAMSRAIVGKVLPQLSHEAVPLRLAGAVDLPGEAEVRSLAEERGLSVAEVQELISRHGSEVRQILAMINRDIPTSRLRMLAAEASYGVAHEFAVTLGDVLNRRTSQLLFSQDNGTAGIKVIAAAMGRVLGWDQPEQEAQVRAYEQEVAEMMAWRN